MKCISVYTDNFELFSDIYETVIATDLKENEEIEVEGVTVSDSGIVPEHYLEKMKVKPEVVVMKVKASNITILQHGKVFEIFIPSEQNMVH